VYVIVAVLYRVFQGSRVALLVYQVGYGLEDQRNLGSIPGRG
jgi:hypothetical protein